MRLQGYLDDIVKRNVAGWAIQDAGDRPARLEVVIDGATETQMCADGFRADLLARELRDGFAAFSYQIPERFCDGRLHEIDVRHVETGLSLGDSPRSFRIRGDVDGRRDWCHQAIIFEHTIGDDFAASLTQTRKLAIFATYHAFATHFVYHRHILEGLTAAGFTVVVVHACDTPRRSLVDLDMAHCFTIVKRNVGYDFGSYAVGILCVAEWLDRIDELLVMNDSVLPITKDLGPLFDRARAAAADVVACTDSYERSYHLQSYMLWFSDAVCRSGVLQRFMASYSFTSFKEDVIEEGEIGLSRMLQAEGFRLLPLFDYTSVAASWVSGCPETVQRIRELPGRAEDEGTTSFKAKLLDRLDTIIDLVVCGAPTNQTHFFWDTLIEAYGFPFLKRELLTGNPCAVPTYFKIADVISARTDVRDAIIDMRRKFGGHLVPSLVPSSDPGDHVRPRPRLAPIRAGAGDGRHDRRAPPPGMSEALVAARP